MYIIEVIGSRIANVQKNFHFFENENDLKDDNNKKEKYFEKEDEKKAEELSYISNINEGEKTIKGITKFDYFDFPYKIKEIKTEKIY